MLSVYPSSNSGSVIRPTRWTINRPADALVFSGYPESVPKTGQSYANGPAQLPIGDDYRNPQPFEKFREKEHSARSGMIVAILLADDQHSKRCARRSRQ